MRDKIAFWYNKVPLCVSRILEKKCFKGKKNDQCNHLKIAWSMALCLKKKRLDEKENPVIFKFNVF